MKVRCKQCGKMVNEDLACHDYFDNPICDECAKIDSYGDICPHCGKKVPFEHMAGSFCDKCSPEAD